jgi:hypothetical protein
MPPWNSAKAKVRPSTPHLVFHAQHLRPGPVTVRRPLSRSHALQMFIAHLFQGYQSNGLEYCSKRRKLKPRALVATLHHYWNAGN